MGNIGSKCVFGLCEGDSPGDGRLLEEMKAHSEGLHGYWTSGNSGTDKAKKLQGFVKWFAQNRILLAVEDVGGGDLGDVLQNLLKVLQKSLLLSAQAQPEGTEASVSELNNIYLHRCIACLMFHYVPFAEGPSETLEGLTGQLSSGTYEPLCPTVCVGDRAVIMSGAPLHKGNLGSDCLEFLFSLPRASPGAMLDGAMQLASSAGMEYTVMRYLSAAVYDKVALNLMWRVVVAEVMMAEGKVGSGRITAAPAPVPAPAPPSTAAPAAKVQDDTKDTPTTTVGVVSAAVLCLVAVCARPFDVVDTYEVHPEAEAGSVPAGLLPHEHELISTILETHEKALRKKKLKNGKVVCEKGSVQPALLWAGALADMLAFRKVVSKSSAGGVLIKAVEDLNDAAKETLASGLWYMREPEGDEAGTTFSQEAQMVMADCLAELVSHRAPGPTNLMKVLDSVVKATSTLNAKAEELATNKTAQEFGKALHIHASDHWDAMVAARDDLQKYNLSWMLTSMSPGLAPHHVRIRAVLACYEVLQVRECLGTEALKRVNSSLESSRMYEQHPQVKTMLQNMTRYSGLRNHLQVTLETEGESYRRIINDLMGKVEELELQLRDTYLESGRDEGESRREVVKELLQNAHGAIKAYVGNLEGMEAQLGVTLHLTQDIHRRVSLLDQKLDTIGDAVDDLRSYFNLMRTLDADLRELKGARDKVLEEAGNYSFLRVGTLSKQRSVEDFVEDYCVKRDGRSYVRLLDTLGAEHFLREVERLMWKAELVEQGFAVERDQAVFTNGWEGVHLPLFADLTDIKEPGTDLVAKVLRHHGFTPKNVEKLKKKTEEGLRLVLLLSNHKFLKMRYQFSELSSDELQEWGNSLVVVMCVSDFMWDQRDDERSVMELCPVETKSTDKLAEIVVRHRIEEVARDVLRDVKRKVDDRLRKLPGQREKVVEVCEILRNITGEVRGCILRAVKKQDLSAVVRCGVVEEVVKRVADWAMDGLKMKDEETAVLNETVFEVVKKMQKKIRKHPDCPADKGEVQMLVERLVQEVATSEALEQSLEPLLKKALLEVENDPSAATDSEEAVTKRARERYFLAISEAKDTVRAEVEELCRTHPQDAARACLEEVTRGVLVELRKEVIVATSAVDDTDDEADIDIDDHMPMPTSGTSQSGSDYPTLLSSSGPSLDPDPGYSLYHWELELWKGRLLREIRALVRTTKQDAAERSETALDLAYCVARARCLAKNDGLERIQMLEPAVEQYFKSYMDVLRKQHPSVSEDDLVQLCFSYNESLSLEMCRAHSTTGDYKARCNAFLREDHPGYVKVDAQLAQDLFMATPFVEEWNDGRDRNSGHEGQRYRYAYSWLQHMFTARSIYQKLAQCSLLRVHTHIFTDYFRPVDKQEKTEREAKASMETPPGEVKGSPKAFTGTQEKNEEKAAELSETPDAERARNTELNNWNVFREGLPVMVAKVREATTDTDQEARERLGNVCRVSSVPRAQWDVRMDDLMNFPDVLNIFLATLAASHRGFRHMLYAMVELSKLRFTEMPAAAAITILAAARESFAGMDLRGVRVAGAHLERAIFDRAEYEESDLAGTGASLRPGMPHEVIDTGCEVVRGGAAYTDSRGDEIYALVTDSKVVLKPKDTRAIINGPSEKAHPHVRIVCQGDILAVVTAYEEPSFEMNLEEVTVRYQACNAKLGALLPCETVADAACRTLGAGDVSVIAKDVEACTDGEVWVPLSRLQNSIMPGETHVHGKVHVHYTLESKGAARESDLAGCVVGITQEGTVWLVNGYGNLSVVTTNETRTWKLKGKVAGARNRSHGALHAVVGDEGRGQYRVVWAVGSRIHTSICEGVRDREFKPSLVSPLPTGVKGVLQGLDLMGRYIIVWTKTGALCTCYVLSIDTGREVKGSPIELPLSDGAVPQHAMSGSVLSVLQMKNDTPGAEAVVRSWHIAGSIVKLHNRQLTGYGAADIFASHTHTYVVAKGKKGSTDNTQNVKVIRMPTQTMHDRVPFSGKITDALLSDDGTMLAMLAEQRDKWTCMWYDIKGGVYHTLAESVSDKLSFAYRMWDGVELLVVEGEGEEKKQNAVRIANQLSDALSMSASQEGKKGAAGNFEEALPGRQIRMTIDKGSLQLHQEDQRGKDAQLYFQRFTMYGKQRFDLFATPHAMQVHTRGLTVAVVSNGSAKVFIWSVPSRRQHGMDGPGNIYLKAVIKSFDALDLGETFAADACGAQES